MSDRARPETRVEGNEPRTAGDPRRGPTARRLAWLLLLYLVIRIPLINLLDWVGPTESGLPETALQVAMYALTAAMIAVSRASLGAYRIDRLSLVLFLVAGIVFAVPLPTSDSTSQNLVFCAYGLVAPALAYLIYRSRHSIKNWAPTSLNWILVALMSTIALRLLLSISYSLITEGQPSIQTVRPLTAIGLAAAFFSFLGDSAVQEEPVFRGFLWGYLESFGLKQPMIWIVQAALFWIAHLRYLDRPFTFWLALPMAGLLLGWLSWKSKSIAASVLAHAAYNSMASYF